MREPPRSIWLQFYGDGAEPLVDDDAAEVTWCKDKINERDIQYVREAWLDRLEKIEAAATNLVNVKGRHHSEKAMLALIDAVKIPHF
ncbi:MAG: hypothetical protein MUE59_03800 [Thiobacillaceae bacterium]|jgi:hypothetical protein|nr:hypothetical protein [Thiobacillaceae bacterium]